MIKEQFYENISDIFNLNESCVNFLSHKYDKYDKYDKYSLSNINCVYKIETIDKTRCYIGCTTNLRRRIRDHYTFLKGMHDDGSIPIRDYFNTNKCKFNISVLHESYCGCLISILEKYEILNHKLTHEIFNVLLVNQKDTFQNQLLSLIEYKTKRIIRLEQENLEYKELHNKILEFMDNKKY